jgi:hypothetical protein
MNQLQLPPHFGGGGGVVVVTTQGVCCDEQSPKHGADGISQAQTEEHPLLVFVQPSNGRHFQSQPALHPGGGVVVVGEFTPE